MNIFRIFAVQGQSKVYFPERIVRSILLGEFILELRIEGIPESSCTRIDHLVSPWPIFMCNSLEGNNKSVSPTHKCNNIYASNCKQAYK